jgi:hypothetical protein
LVGADFWRSKAIPEKNVPAFKTSDGPNGARGAIFKAGTKVQRQLSMGRYHTEAYCKSRLRFSLVVFL